jgi:hypothetical protein
LRPLQHELEPLDFAIALIIHGARLHHGRAG